MEIWKLNLKISLLQPLVLSSNKFKSLMTPSVYQGKALQQQHITTTRHEISPRLNCCINFVNKATLINISQSNHSTLVTSQWRLTTVEQVEDLKTLIKIFPIWSTRILLCTSLPINNSLTILQALKMDRTITTGFKIPIGSMIVFMLASTAASLTLIDRLIYLAFKKLTGHYPTLLQRIGVDHLVNVSTMFLSAIVESRRLKQGNERKYLMSALWLAPQFVIVGVGEAFHYAGQVAFYYRDFPAYFRSTSTAMQAVIIAISYYLSMFTIGIVRKVTKWLPDINDGRVDNVYWMLSVICGLNFVYYIVCTWLYKYKRNKQDNDELNVVD